MLGYLERRDPYNMNLFGPEWKRSYCVLSATGVFSHHSSHQEISFNPRGFAEVKVRRCGVAGDTSCWFGCRQLIGRNWFRSCL